MNGIYLIIFSALTCIPLVGIGMYLDVVVYDMHPFWNMGKGLGVLAVIQLAICGVSGLILEYKTSVTDGLSEDKK